MIAIILLAFCLARAGAAKYYGPTNQAGINLIKQFEGFHPNFYQNPRGIRTIGYGHECPVYNCNAPIGGKYAVPLNQVNGERLLKDDLKAPNGYEQCVRYAVTNNNLNANQFSALVSFTFSVGCYAFRGSQLLYKLNRGDVAGAANDLGNLVYAGGRQVPGSYQRRAAEKALFCSGGACAVCRSGAGGTTCTGKVTANGVKMRSMASTLGIVVGNLANQATVTITGRVTGTVVNGNWNWFKLYNGYVPAYYINIISNNGAFWCKKN